MSSGPISNTVGPDARLNRTRFSRFASFRAPDSRNVGPMERRGIE
jgi:hypothetical protein